MPQVMRVIEENIGQILVSSVGVLLMIMALFFYSELSSDVSQLMEGQLKSMTAIQDWRTEVGVLKAEFDAFTVETRYWNTKIEDNRHEINKIINNTISAEEPYSNTKGQLLEFRVKSIEEALGKHMSEELVRTQGVIKSIDELVDKMRDIGEVSGMSGGKSGVGEWRVPAGGEDGGQRGQ